MLGSWKFLRIWNPCGPIDLVQMLKPKLVTSRKSPKQQGPVSLCNFCDFGQKIDLQYFSCFITKRTRWFQIRNNFYSQTIFSIIFSRLKNLDKQFMVKYCEFRSLFICIFAQLIFLNKIFYFLIFLKLLQVFLFCIFWFFKTCRGFLGF